MKIAIVGAHRASRLAAPYDDKAWSIWTCSQRNESVLPRHDVWFELHGLDVVNGLSQEYRGWLKGCPRLYMQDVTPEYPNATPYPIDYMVAHFGTWFLSNSIPMMMALAITKEPEAIGLWGVSASKEFYEQRHAIRHFASLAKMEGIRVEAPADPEVFARSKVYGYET